MLDPVFAALNTSTFFIGIMMLLLNVGSRYITHELSDNDEEYRQNIFIRRLAVFAVCFVGTRDVVASLVLTAAFVVLSTGLFQNKSIFAREGMSNKGSTTVDRAVVVGAAGLY
jgi:hypothetical protein